MRARTLFVQAALGAGVLLGHSWASAADAPAPPPPGPLLPLAKDPARDPASIDFIPLGPPPSSASMTPTTGVFLGLGAATMLAGGIMMLAAPSNDLECGVTGCYDVPDNVLRHQGYLTLATGTGFSIVSGLALLHSVLSDGTPRQPRYSDDMTRLGIFMTALGSGLAALSVTDAVANPSRYGFLGDPTTLMTASALGAWALIPAGITIWCIGASEPMRASALSLRFGPSSAHFSMRF